MKIYPFEYNEFARIQLAKIEATRSELEVLHKIIGKLIASPHDSESDSVRLSSDSGLKIVKVVFDL